MPDSAHRASYRSKPPIGRTSTMRRERFRVRARGTEADAGPARLILGAFCESLGAAVGTAVNVAS